MRRRLTAISDDYGKLGRLCQAHRGFSGRGVVNIWRRRKTRKRSRRFFKHIADPSGKKRLSRREADGEKGSSQG